MIYGLLLSGAVRTAVVLAAGLVAHALVSRGAAATRRFVLVLTLGAAIAVPVAAAFGPRWAVEAPAALAVFARESANEAALSVVPAGGATQVVPTPIPRAGVLSSAANLDPMSAVVLVWLVVAMALLVRAAASQMRARAIVKRAAPVESTRWSDAGGSRHVEVRSSHEVDSPAVMGLLQPTIVIPESALDWSVERCRLVLVHELAHVRRYDGLAQAIADVACAIHWCNPLVWICARLLRVEREIAADDAVLATGVRPSHYAEELVAVATTVAAPSAALAMAERSTLERRVTSILALRLRRAELAARGTVGIAACAAAFAAAVACASATPSEPRHLTEPGVAPQAGASNDAAIQRIADDEMGALVTEWAPDLATIIVLDPSTGAILANAGRSAGKPADVASTVALAPGSTLKPITIAAALELHAITADQKFECGPSPRTYGDKAIRDFSANGKLDVARLLAVSSNIGTSRIFDALGGEQLAVWLRRFHFGETPSLPSATTGAFATPIVTGTFEGAAVAMGVRITATPFQMIAAYGAIANDGVYHAPTLARGGSPAERLLSSETAKAVMAMLETAVVDKAATGKAARVDGTRVAGKTGTSEWTAPDGRRRTYASFIGVADLPSRRIVALVGIEGSRDDLSGGKAAAPVFARLVKRIRAK
jgi:beta-lactamase regulating signal transducer with metallopeptidase domain